MQIIGASRQCWSTCCQTGSKMAAGDATSSSTDMSPRRISPTRGLPSMPYMSFARRTLRVHVRLRRAGSTNPSTTLDVSYADA